MTRIPPGTPGRPEHGPGTADAIRGAVGATFLLVGAVCVLSSLTGPASWPATLAVLVAAPLVCAHTYATATVLVWRCP
jgi:hypothetical protein